MQLKKHYFLMISCPSDVVRERELLKECVEIVNNERNDDSWVELRYWVTDTFSDAGTPAQESINRQIVDESDGLIAIFNARLGTPVHSYPCGTAEEIALMLAAKKHVSLLFNTAPRIDLTKDNSIDQITKLQAYKKEQSANSFYKEFKDEESFKSIALQEIRLWVRSLNSAGNQVIILDGGTVGTESSETTETDDNPVTDIITSRNDVSTEDNDNKQPEMGILDCVLYITNTSIELTTLFDQYGALVENFQTKADVFVQKFSYTNKQNNAAASLALCKGFAIETTEWGNQLNLFNNDIESKWNNICSYIKMVPRDMIPQDDKIIMKSSLATLRGQFSYMMSQTNELLLVIDKIPNIQRDFNSAMKTVKSAFVKFDKFLGTAIINCDELENLFV